MEVMEDVIHHSLERTGQICQAEEHDQWFKQAIFGLKCSLFLITSFDSDIIVAPANIKLCEDVGVLSLTNQVWNEQ